MARLLRGWRGLGVFWLAVILVTAGLAGWLQWLGPPASDVASVVAPGHVVASTAPAAAPAAPDPRPPGQIAEPVAALLEPSKAFPPAMLPRIGPAGRLARSVYARPVAAPADGRPRIAILMLGVGMSINDSRNAIDNLPGAVSLAFSPYAADVEPIEALSRKAGHEMLVSIPMESQGFPLNDAGSRSLLTGAPAEQNARNLEWALGRIQGYVGAVGALDAMRGEVFADQTSSLDAVLADLKRRGLLYVDPRPGAKGPAADHVAQVPGRGVDLVIDDPPARAEIEAKLAGLERIARDKGAALGLAGPLRPVTIDRIAAWSRGLADRGIALVPVSALVDTPATTTEIAGPSK